MSKRNIVAVLALGATLLGATLSSPAFAWHRGPHVGVVIGGPLWWGPGYYSPYYYYPPYYPPVVVAPAAPPTYIEQGSAPASAGSSSYWYYCSDAKAYYPYVKECPGGWQRVAPQPQN